MEGKALTIHPIDYIREHSGEFGSLPFWSWNDRLKPDELTAQIEHMKALGMKGFFMHARAGLETAYLSEEWMEAVRVCVDKAAELDMQAWLYDENGWPSGFAGRRLLEDPHNRNAYLRMSEEAVYPTDMAGSLWEDGAIGVYRMDGGVPRRLCGPDGGVGPYLVVRRFFENSYVDTLNPAVTAQFIEHTHEIYFRRFGERLGSRHMPGFFTDEPQYFRYATVWSSVLPEAFRQRYGRDVYDVLPALFIEYPGAREARYDYWLLCHRLFLENWARPVSDWCSRHGCLLTGHAIEESRLSTQMWCCGGVMPFYAYEHIPGIDHLGRGLDFGLEAKQVGSAAAQLGKKRVLSEMFAGCGYDASPLDLKRIAESAYVDGVNLMCQHLYPYSGRGERKYDYPLHFSESLPWQPLLREFNTYFNRLGCALSMGREAVEVLLLHPMHSVYLDYRREPDGESVRKVEDGLFAAMALLQERQIPYHLGDEILLAEHARVQGSALTVGECRYTFVVLPCGMETVDAPTAALLDAYTAAGGRLLLLGDSPCRIDGRETARRWASTASLEELLGCAPVRFISSVSDTAPLRCMVRELDGGRLVYVFNRAEEPVRAVEVAGLHNPCRLELETLTLHACTDADGRVVLDLPVGGSCLLLEGDFGVPLPAAVPAAYTHRLPLTSRLIRTDDGENQLLLDRASAVLEDGVLEEMPVELLRRRLLERRYAGEVRLRFGFTLRDIPEKLYAVAEPLACRSVTCNGHPLTASGRHFFDPRFDMYDLNGCLTPGENRLEFCFPYAQDDAVYDVLFGQGTESLRNCLCFNVEPERVILTGDFLVETDPEAFAPVPDSSWVYSGGFALRRGERAVDVGDLVRGGLPFFAGCIALSCMVDCPACSAARLTVSGRYAACRVLVNDHEAGALLFGRSCELTGLLWEGKNRITLLVYTGNRNLIGPLHREDIPPMVSPGCFTFETDPENYVPSYRFGGFGVDAVLEWAQTDQL